MTQQVFVLGASRGLGLEMVRQYRAAGAQVVGTARAEPGLRALRELGAEALRLDVADAASCSGLAWQLDGRRFDVALYNAGVIGDHQDALNPPTQAAFDATFHANVLGAMWALPQMAECLAPGAVLAVMSSRMGSLGARTNGGSWLYRASKAALNSVLKDAAFALEGKAHCVALHPGWVQTDMGGPDADLTAQRSAADLRALLATVGPQHHGGFFNHDGTALPW